MPVSYKQFLEIPNFPDDYLRLPRFYDGPQMYDVVQANREHLRYQWWTTQVQTRPDAHQHVTNTVDNNDAGDRMQYYLSAGVPVPNGPIRGSVTAYEIEPELRHAKVGWWVVKDAQGRGLATAATRRLLTELQEVYGTESVEAHIADDNAASRRLAQRIGFEPTENSYEVLVGGHLYLMDRWSMQL